MVSAKDRLKQHKRKSLAARHAALPSSMERRDELGLGEGEEGEENADWSWRLRNCTCKDGRCVPRFHIDVKPRQESGSSVSAGAELAAPTCNPVGNTTTTTTTNTGAATATATATAAARKE